MTQSIKGDNAMKKTVTPEDSVKLRDFFKDKANAEIVKKYMQAIAEQEGVALIHTKQGPGLYRVRMLPGDRLEAVGLTKETPQIQFVAKQNLEPIDNLDAPVLWMYSIYSLTTLAVGLALPPLLPITAILSSIGLIKIYAGMIQTYFKRMKFVWWTDNKKKPTLFLVCSAKTEGELDLMEYWERCDARLHP